VNERAALPDAAELLWVAAALDVVAAELAAGREIFVSPALLRAAVRLLRRAAGEAEPGEGDE
jgi:hypothetical protein